MPVDLANAPDDDVISALRAASRGQPATELAELLARLRGKPLSQSMIVFFFARAFPAIPLRTLLETGAWHRVGAGSMSDAEFDALLGPFIDARERA